MARFPLAQRCLTHYRRTPRAAMRGLAICGCVCEARGMESHVPPRLHQRPATRAERANARRGKTNSDAGRASGLRESQACGAGAGA